jgi:ferredoxin
MGKIVWVDREACISCGLCVSILPEVFRFEGGKSLAYAPSGASEMQIQSCIDGCPVEAIQWRTKNEHSPE